MLLSPLNVAIVDDHTLFRKTLKNYLADQKNINVVIQTSSLYDLIDQLSRTRVDVLLVDLVNQGLDGSESLKVIRERHPDIKILAMSMNRDLDMISELMSIGVEGCISKAEEPEELLRAIQSIANFGIYRNCLYTEALYRDKQNMLRNGKGDQMIILNEREKKILLMLWEEKTNKEMANALFLGVRSIEKIRQDLKEKIGVKSTIGMVKYAINKRIIPKNVLELK